MRPCLNALREPLLRVLISLAVFLIPYCLQYHYVVNAFYHYGAPYFDAGLFAHTVWRNDAVITTPHPYGNFSYLAVHFSPFLVLVNGLSWLLPFSMVTFFSGFIAASYALLALVMYAGFMLVDTQASLARRMLYGALAVAFSFTGVVMQGIWMPHFEYYIPLGILAFLLCYYSGRKGWAGLLFALVLGMREDAGFHMAVVLAGLAVCKAWEDKSLKAARDEIALTVGALIYGCIAWFLMAKVREASQTSLDVFNLIYTGTPPYAHLTWQLISERLLKFAHKMLYLSLPFAVSLAFAFYYRSLLLAIGVLAGLPWFILQITAINDNTGGIYAYYAFPFVVTMGWGIIAAYVAKDNPALRRAGIRLQIILALAGLVLWNDYTKRFEWTAITWAQWGSYQPRAGADEQDVIQALIDKLVNKEEGLGQVRIDRNVMSLASGQEEGRHLLRPGVEGEADSYLYFNPFGAPLDDEQKSIVEGNHLTGHYCVLYTPICLFTRIPQEQVEQFFPAFNAKPAP